MPLGEKLNKVQTLLVKNWLCLPFASRWENECPVGASVELNHSYLSACSKPEPSFNVFLVVCTVSFFFSTLNCRTTIFQNKIITPSNTAKTPPRVQSSSYDETCKYVLQPFAPFARLQMTVFLHVLVNHRCNIQSLWWKWILFPQQKQHHHLWLNIVWGVAWSSTLADVRLKKSWFCYLKLFLALTL